MTTRSSLVAERLHNRKFQVAGNPHGLPGAGTVFEYQVDGTAITSTYRGGRIRKGHQMGHVTGPDTFDLLFHYITTDGEIFSGRSRGKVEVDAAGRTTLSFVWAWLSGASGGGESSYVELDSR
ncbi:hypothetical protein SAMN03159495_5410 [Pseudomonas sp. NFR16]|nr:hypothetical protein [Pseudomonas sp. NFR16]SEJ94543.1 hypothetical protein SAMN03159495_5410 [Pseudomonas sp. NFR16]